MTHSIAWDQEDFGDSPDAAAARAAAEIDDDEAEAARVLPSGVPRALDVFSKRNLFNFLFTPDACREIFRIRKFQELSRSLREPCESRLSLVITGRVLHDHASPLLRNGKI